MSTKKIVDGLNINSVLIFKVYHQIQLHRMEEITENRCEIIGSKKFYEIFLWTFKVSNNGPALSPANVQVSAEYVQIESYKSSGNGFSMDGNEIIWKCV